MRDNPARQSISVLDQYFSDLLVGTDGPSATVSASRISATDSVARIKTTSTGGDYSAQAGTRQARRAAVTAEAKLSVRQEVFLRKLQRDQLQRDWRATADDQSNSNDEHQNKRAQSVDLSTLACRVFEFFGCRVAIAEAAIEDVRPLSAEDVHAISLALRAQGSAAAGSAQATAGSETVPNAEVCEASETIAFANNNRLKYAELNALLEQATHKATDTLPVNAMEFCRRTAKSEQAVLVQLRLSQDNEQGILFNTVQGVESLALHALQSPPGRLARHLLGEAIASGIVASIDTAQLAEQEAAQGGEKSPLLLFDARQYRRACLARQVLLQ